MNEFCVLVNITPGRSPEGEFLVSHRETMKLYPKGLVLGCARAVWLCQPGCLLVGVVSVDFTGRGSLRNEITS